VRSFVAVLAALMTTGLVSTAPPAAADPVPPAPPECNYPDCTPGIMPNVVLGSYCDNFTYYAFGVTNWGRLVFCGSPRRYEPRWFRSPEMHGIKEEGEGCDIGSCMAGSLMCTSGALVVMNEIDAARLTAIP
jgi:hypothetical protein